MNASKIRESDRPETNGFDASALRSSGTLKMRFDDRHEVVVTGPWSADMINAVQNGIADRVICNYALGFNEPDLGFLEYLPIKQLVILDPRISDLASLYTLSPTLELLHLTVDPHVTIDLTAFPLLRDLSANWSQVADTITGARRLKRTALSSYQPADLTPLAGLDTLISIAMKDRPRIRSLAGLGQLPDLTHLGIYSASRLDDVADLRGRERIESLYLQGCPRLDTTEEILTVAPDSASSISPRAPNSTLALHSVPSPHSRSSISTAPPVSPTATSPQSPSCPT